MLETTNAPTGIDSQQVAWRAMPRRLFGLLLALDLFFVAAHLVLVFANMRRTVLFTSLDLGVESNVPTAYSAFQLLLLGAIFLALGSRLIPQRRKVAGVRRLWRVLGAGFVFLAFDEIGMVHERLPTWRLRVFNLPNVDPWMAMYATIGVVLVAVLLTQVVVAWREWRGQVLLFVCGMGVYATGALVMEGLNYVLQFEGLMRYIEIAAEEGFEMIGVTIIVLAASTILTWAMTSAPDAERTGSP